MWVVNDQLTQITHVKKTLFKNFEIEEKYSTPLTEEKKLENF